MTFLCKLLLISQIFLLSTWAVTATDDCYMTFPMYLINSATSLFIIHSLWVVLDYTWRHPTMTKEICLFWIGASFLIITIINISFYLMDPTYHLTRLTSFVIETLQFIVINTVCCSLVIIYFFASSQKVISMLED